MAQSYEWVVWRFDPGNPRAYGTFMVPQTITVFDADGDGRLSIDSGDLMTARRSMRSGSATR